MNYYPVDVAHHGKKPDSKKRKKLPQFQAALIAAIILAVFLLTSLAFYITDKIIHPQMIKVLVEPILEYDNVMPCGEGLLTVCKEGKCGLIDKYGDIVVPLIYGNIGNFNEGLAVVNTEMFRCGKVGVIDSTGNVVIDFIYEGIAPVDDGMITVCNEGKIGIIDQNGEVLVPLIYGEISGFCDGLAIVGINDLGCGLIDTKGNIVVPAVYDNIEHIAEDDRLIVAEQNGKEGILNLKGDIILPFEYDSINIRTTKDNLICVENNGLWGIAEVKKRR
jgi:hypothetical protein